MNPAEIRRLVEMQNRSYQLLRWVAEAVRKGFIRFETAHKYSTFTDVAQDWLQEHYLNIPERARWPSRHDLSEFCAFFSTYLSNSFDLIQDPGKRLYSPAGHCFCPMCSWFVEAPNLQPKKLRPVDKKRAQMMRIAAIENLAAARGRSIAEADLIDLLQDRTVFESASLLAYGVDLTQRVKGIANGPAVLALWRGFAWNEAGSPKPGFRLDADLIIAAESQWLELIDGLEQ